MDKLGKSEVEKQTGKIYLFSISHSNLSSQGPNVYEKIEILRTESTFKI